MVVDDVLGQYAQENGEKRSRDMIAQKHNLSNPRELESDCLSAQRSDLRLLVAHCRTHMLLRFITSFHSVNSLWALHALRLVPTYASDRGALLGSARPRD